jgi:hypothetical protein
MQDVLGDEGMVDAAVLVPAQRGHAVLTDVRTHPLLLETRRGQPPQIQIRRRGGRRRREGMNTRGRAAMRLVARELKI